MINQRTPQAVILRYDMPYNELICIYKENLLLNLKQVNAGVIIDSLK